MSNRVSRRQSGRWATQDQQAQQEAPPYDVAAAPPPPQAADPMDAKLAQLRQLAELKDQGVLSESEFAAQKAQILGV